MTKTVNDTAMSEALMAAVQQLLAQTKPAKRSRKAKGAKREKSTPELKATRMAANDAECVKVFTAAGYVDVQPRINVRTYGKQKPDGTITGWLGEGRKVKTGEKSHQVGPFRLFHIDQTSPITEVDVEAIATSH